MPEAEHDKRFDVFIILLLFFLNVIISGIIIIFINFLGKTVFNYFLIALVAFLCGWMTISVAKRFYFSAAKAVWTSIISTSGALFKIVLLCTLFSLMGPVLMKQNNVDPSMYSALPSLFISFSLVEIIILVVIYILFFNLKTVLHFFKIHENSAMKNYLYAVIGWIVIFIFTRVLVSTIAGINF